MEVFLRTLKVFFQIVGGSVATGLAIWAFAAMGLLPGVFGVFLLLFVNGWAVYAFLSHRQGRQDELAQVLGAATMSGVPLAAAVEAYRKERPRPGGARDVLEIMSRAALPLYGYVRIWIGWHQYDTLLKQFSQRLSAGEALSAAMGSTPGLASRELRLAVAVGERTGSLQTSFKRAANEGWSAMWTEVAPRVLYPSIVFLIVANLTMFLSINILPKFKKIFDEFGQKFPAATQIVFDASNYMVDFAVELELLPVLAVAGVAYLIASPTARWRVPIIGWFYRCGVQAACLQALGKLLAAGLTIPQALEFLEESGAFAGVVQRRLSKANWDVERGGALDDALRDAQLLPPSMAPLVSAAERVHNLPWALGELGGHLASRAFQQVRRASLVVAPIVVVALGAMVGFIALGMFMPLIHLLTRLGE
jgi:type IV pilus assembly protein PilC